MIANYHTHTTRCHHAVGSEEEYCISAINYKLKILGFSDHTPYPFPEGHVSNFRMEMDRLEDYVETILALKSKYKDKIDIKLGLEVEYYPKYFDKLLGILENYPIEYMIQGQHFVGNEINDHYCGDVTDSDELLERYCKQSIEGFETGKFAYFCHPDLFNYIGSDKTYDKWMRYLCQSARELNIPLEINQLGLVTKRNYPNERFWKIAGEEGCIAILGSDAHNPKAICNEETQAYSLEMVDRFGLRLIDSLEIC